MTEKTDRDLLVGELRCRMAVRVVRDSMVENVAKAGKIRLVPRESASPSNAGGLDATKVLRCGCGLGDVVDSCDSGDGALV